MIKKIKIILFVFSLFFVILLGACSKDETYVATKYNIVTITNVNGVTGDQIISDLSEFSLYNLYLKDDNTFSLKYKRNSEKNSMTYSGTYKKENGQLILTYVDIYPDEMLSIPTYKISEDGKTLTRSQNVIDSENNFICRIDQEFKRK